MAKGRKNNTAHEVPKIPTSAELLMQASETSAKSKDLKPKSKKK